MMSEFSLSRGRELPSCIQEEGVSYPVRTDFRVILRILRMLCDPEVMEKDKPSLLRRMFFVQDAPRDVQGAFAWFVRRGHTDEPGGGVRDFDYEQDAAELYAAFYAVYHMDLLAVKTLHWWAFSALTEGLFAGENALSSKVRLRHLDDSEGMRKAQTARARAYAALKTRASAAEQNREQQIRVRLLAGQPIDDLMGGMQDG